MGRSVKLTSFVTETEIAKSSFGIFTSGALRYLERTRDFDEFRGRAFGKTKFQFDVLVRSGL